MMRDEAEKGGKGHVSHSWSFGVFLFFFPPKNHRKPSKGFKGEDGRDRFEL